MRSINVGLIGVGPRWESRYRPAIEKMHGRIRVSAVFDHVFSRAESVAKSLDATAVSGVLAMLERPDVSAILMLDPDWHGTALLDRICSKGKPVYLGQPACDGLLSSEQLHSIAVLSGTMVMPELERRYQPCSARLQELMATRIGRPERVSLNFNSGVPVTDPNTRGVEQLVELFDWCRYIARTVPESLVVSTGVDGSMEIRVQFRQPNSGETPMDAELKFSVKATEAFECRIDAAAGEASFSTVDSIEWRADTDAAIERLAQDRTAVEVMLDHFCRRVVGGLVPVPDLGDVCTALRLVEAMEQALRTKSRVSLSRVL